MTRNTPPNPKDLDPFDDLEENFIATQEAQGYKEGYELGARDGQRDGELLGMEDGSNKGSELGYFHGFTMTYKQLVCAEQQTHPRSINLLNDILKLIDEFPRTNETNCEEKLANIRIKFRQAFMNTPLALNSS